MKVIEGNPDQAPEAISFTLKAVLKAYKVLKEELKEQNEKTKEVVQALQMEN